MKAYALVNAIVMQLSILEQSVKSLDVFVYEWKRAANLNDDFHLQQEQMSWDFVFSIL